MTAEERCYGIVERLLGEKYKTWFDFQIVSGDEDTYVLSSENNKIKICGNNGVSIAAGLRYYLSHFCQVYIGQQTTQTNLPACPCPIDKPISRTARSRLRYAYNYCTLSYSMPFWDEARWQRELDWLALSGVNLVLDFTGIEEVWYRFLLALGYTDEEIRRWIVSPCYTAWQQMQNIESYGAICPRAFYAERAELARKNQRFMLDMGMLPVRQGYSGMVPSFHSKHEPSVSLFQQGEWNGLPRPAMLDTRQAVYRDYAALFYQIQEEVLGIGSHYYAMDVFHEGGIRPKDLGDEQIAHTVLSALLAHDKNAVWVIQAWHKNPTEELLKGIAHSGSKHALVLDLSATDNPQWQHSEFSGTPWVYCMLDMYGGRVSTHGELSVLAEKIPEARQRAHCMQGIGFTSEATLHNPVTFDLLFDTVWEDVSLKAWLRTWLTSRYGQFDRRAFEAWEELLQTAYADPGYSHHGGYTQIFTFRPHRNMMYGEIFNELGSTVIKKPYYDTAKFEQAVWKLAETADTFSDNECWQYDMQDLLRQLLNNRACEQALTANEARKSDHTEAFEKARDTFFELLLACDAIMSIRSDTLLSDWLGYAFRAGEKYGKETADAFVRDARNLITAWAGEKSHRKLADYAYRQYGGMLRTYYLKRWQAFFAAREEISVDEWYSMALDFITEASIENNTVLPASETIRQTLALLAKTSPVRTGA